MPAVTVADWTSLPRLSVPASSSRERPVASVSTAPSGYEGEGFPVRRAFAGRTFAELDPFVHMDQMGEVEYAPGEPKGTPWHPHRGFETVTYMIDGTFAHQDSNGGGGLITDGATQWMTGGRGILHIETPPEQLVVSGGLFHGIQLWVNLPAKKKWIAPAYQPLEADDVTLLASADGGALVRVIAGELGGMAGPGSTHTPISLVHASISPGAAARGAVDPELQRPGVRPRRIRHVGSERRPAQRASSCLFGPGEWLSLRAAERQDSRSPNLEVLLLGGEPIGEHVEHYGPFVMNTRAEIGQAVEDFQAGRLGRIPPNALMPHDPDPAPVRTERTGI